MKDEWESSADGGGEMKHTDPARSCLLDESCGRGGQRRGDAGEDEGSFP